MDMKKNILALVKTKNKGFSLIELLVVISIIGVLAGVLLMNFVGVRERAADTKRKNDLVQLKKALRLYYNDNQAYPSNTARFPAGGNFTSVDGSVVYMKDVPEYSEYAVSSDGERFALTIVLDNLSDKDLENSQDKCSLNLSLLSGFDDEVHYVVCED